MASTHLSDPLERERSARLRGAFAPAAAKIRLWSDAEAGRLALWAPVAIGAGAVLYFTLRQEPPSWAGPLLAAASGGAFLLVRNARRWCAAILLTALGFAAADIRAALVEAPILARALQPREVRGRLVSIDEAPGMRRLMIELEEIEGVDAAATPRRARLSWRGKEFDVLPGDVVTLRAALSPPPPPEAPDGFDYARHLYFEGVGAVGYAVTAPAKRTGRRLTPGERASASIERARLAITRRILEAAPGQGGAMVAASVTGHRGAIDEETETALRDSGLAHLVAISGLNMALATGLIFFAVRGLLAMIEPVALRFPIKKWAAIAALCSGFVYLLLSGGEWSAFRAFLMTAIIFIAILFDRRAFSLRNVAIAATVILLIAPEAVLHPGFQMSFAAVAALVAAYEWSAARSDPNRSFSPFARARRYMVGIAATDIVAATATSPFSLYHFNQSAIYSLPANIVAIPLMGFVVMPMAVVGLILMPFGLDAWAWRAAAKGVEAIIAVGAGVAGLPGAVVTIAQWPPAALGVLTVGGLWLCLQSQPWRFAGLAAVPIAAILVVQSPAPALFVTSEGENAGVVIETAAGRRLAMFNVRKNGFAASVWKEHAGLDPRKSPTASMAEVGRCDRAGCAVLVADAVLAVSRDPLGLGEDCRRAAVVIALYPAPRRAARTCRARLIDRREAWANGAHAIWMGENIRIKTVSEMRGRRPWTAPPRE